eukprot:24940_1
MQINIIFILALLFIIYYNGCNGKSCTCRVSTQAACEAAGYLKYDTDGNVERQCTWEPSHHKCRNTVWLECMKDENCIWINKITDEAESKQTQITDRMDHPCGIDQEDDEEYFDEQEIITNQQPDNINAKSDENVNENENENAFDDQQPNNDNAYTSSGDEQSADPTDENNDLPDENADPMDAKSDGTDEYSEGTNEENEQLINDSGQQDIILFASDENTDINEEENELIIPVDENSEQDEFVSGVYAAGDPNKYFTEGGESDGINKQENADIMVSSMRIRSDNIEIFALFVVVFVLCSGCIYHFSKQKKGKKLLGNECEGKNGKYTGLAGISEHRSYSTF